jgi:hypothetical protein
LFAGRKENSFSHAVVLNPAQQIKMAAVIELWSPDNHQASAEKSRQVLLKASDV